MKKRERVVYARRAIFGGVIGLHRMYVGGSRWNVLWILTLPIAFVWGVVHGLQWMYRKTDQEFALEFDPEVILEFAREADRSGAYEVALSKYELAAKRGSSYTSELPRLSRLAAREMEYRADPKGAETFKILCDSHLKSAEYGAEAKYESTWTNGLPFSCVGQLESYDPEMAAKNGAGESFYAIHLLLSHAVRGLFGADSQYNTGEFQPIEIVDDPAEIYLIDSEWDKRLASISRIECVEFVAAFLKEYKEKLEAKTEAEQKLAGIKFLVKEVANPELTKRPDADGRTKAGRRQLEDWKLNGGEQVSKLREDFEKSGTGGKLASAALVGIEAVNTKTEISDIQKKLHEMNSNRSKLAMKSVTWLRGAADTGIAAACARYGTIMSDTYKGYARDLFGCEPNWNEAVEYLNRAASIDPRYHFQLWQVLSRGSVSQSQSADIARAGTHLRLAAEAGCGVAQDELGNQLLTSGAEDESRKFLEGAAVSGMSRSQFLLGMMLLKSAGLVVDLKETPDWEDVRSSNEKHSHVLLNQDVARAVELIEQAALNGLADACVALGTICLFSKYGRKDLKKSAYWFERATVLNRWLASNDQEIKNECFYRSGRIWTQILPESDPKGMLALRNAMRQGHRLAIAFVFGSEYVDDVVNNQIRSGMSIDAVDFVVDSFHKEFKSESRGKSIVKRYYKGAKDGEGNSQFVYKFVFEDKVLVEWEEGKFNP